jgi:phosphoribosyl 1,2-cyclic phosphodiesterase
MILMYKVIISNIFLKWVIMLKFLVLGTGGAFDSFQSNFIADLNNELLLIDAGTTICRSLAFQKKSPDKINHIVITHFHHDHVGGLAEVLMSRYWNRPASDSDKAYKPPYLYVREKQILPLTNLLKPQLEQKGIQIKDFCKFIKVEDYFYINQFKINIITTDHLHCPGVDSFGLKITDTQCRKNLLITSDIKNLNESNILNAIDDLTQWIVQDISLQCNPVHANIEEVLSYYPSKLIPKICGVHYGIHQDDPYDIHLLKQGEELRW